jgi:NADH:ubiquinone oxidoreductase subunit F (NADH-binding)/NADH:ubiquinone oxidoreductase subunit E/Pyruvate/2-oxoacid:ferredoxin oxidoreductase delta subunit
MIQESYDLFLEKLLAKTGRGTEATVPILQGIQEEYHYLPEPVLRRVSELTGIGLGHLVSVGSFYHQFRFKPTGQHRLRVCHGTACHVKSSQNIQDAIERALLIPANDDTSPDGEFTVERVACLGCCTLAPAVQIDHTTYGHLAPDTVGMMLDDFRATRHETVADVDAVLCQRETVGKPEIRVGLGSCCMAKGSDELFHLLRSTVKDFGLDVPVKRVGCVGMCHQTPIVEIRLPNKPAAFYSKVTPEQAEGIVRRHFPPANLGRRLVRWVDRTLEELVTANGGLAKISEQKLDMASRPVELFMGRQIRIASEGFGEMDPIDLDEYLAHDGFKALNAARGRKPEDVIADITASGLRGRGGAGFPTGVKWGHVRHSKSKDGIKYVIVNGDEGDPGAFMDRMLMESFPYRVIEGMMIGGYAVGANEGYIYVRAEYPRAVTRLREAIRRMTERGFLNDFKLHIFEGAGAFVCGEATAMVESIEGHRGIPRMKPPRLAESGLWGRPTLLNNVETFAMVPWIIRHGHAAFAALGTEKSKGTKVFALAGKIARAGLIEVPMGITIREVVEEIGGGVPDGKRFKAVQIGGPSGGCIPASLGNTTVDFEALTEVGAMMGSGGLVVLDEDDCMVDVARYFMSFLRNESCGQCTFCRIGTTRMWEILDKICNGKGRQSDLDDLKQLATFTEQGSMCGLGKSAPNPVLSTLRYFLDEYEEHLKGRCPAGRCKPLIQYVVQDNCTGCTICAQHCPANAIPITPYQRHKIDLEKCTRCDVCRTDCPVEAIHIESGGQKTAGHLHKEQPAHITLAHQ